MCRKPVEDSGLGRVKGANDSPKCAGQALGSSHRSQTDSILTHKGQRFENFNRNTEVDLLQRRKGPRWRIGVGGELIERGDSEICPRTDTM